MSNSIGDYTFKVTPEELQKQAESILNSIKLVRGKFEDFISRIKGSSNYWEGIAADTYRNRCLEYETLLEDVLASLTEHAADLKDIAVIYTNVEQLIDNETEDLPGDIIL